MDKVTKNVLTFIKVDLKYLNTQDKEELSEGFSSYCGERSKVFVQIKIVYTWTSVSTDCW